MAIAREIQLRLCDAELEEYMGSYLLGSTAPDIRVITMQPREETHFYDFDGPNGGSGIPKLLKSYPHLLQLRGRGRAFLAGYITHLAVDELWIDHVYRPYFGRESSLHNAPEADIMDRVLQFHMDRAERADHERFQQFYECIFQADPGEEVRFIDVPTLDKWREVVGSIINQDPSWEAFRSFAIRRLLGGGQPDEKKVRSLFESLPDVLERALQHVTAERVAAFREDAIQHAATAVRTYCS